MRRLVRQFALAAILCVTTGGSNAAELIVSAASSLTNAFTELGKAFDKVHPGDRIVLNFGGSGQLLQQIERGAPVQVFASADQETMDRAQARGLIDVASRADFTRNALVLIVPSDSTLAVSGLDSLRAVPVKRIAVSNPDSVPVGRYTKEVLVNAGLWELLQIKLINTQNVRQSLDYVARGEVDAGFVYSTDASIMAGKVRVVAEIATATPIRYPIAAVKGNGLEALAREFIAFVRSEAGETILGRFGFQRR